MTTVHAKRLTATQAALQRAGVDALLVTPGPDLRYLTGYQALPLERLTCLVVRARSEPQLVVPTLELPAAQASPAAALDIQDWGETEDAIALVARLIPDARSIAVDDHMWAEKLLRFQAATPDASYRPAADILASLRLRKDDREVSELALAAQAIDRVHARMGEWLRIGRTEVAVAADIARAIVDEGHVTADFVIVASGPNGASPHHEPDQRVIQPGDPVVVDIGGTTHAGYCSDSTRMYCIGEPPTDFTEYYTVLQQAQAASVAAVEPGVTAESVDAAGRDIIEAAGYGEYFMHRTGHGIGMETHEEPYIIAGNSTRLEPGMAFSIEPGIYLPGRHGARIEDIVVCIDSTEGVQVLNQQPTELIVL